MRIRSVNALGFACEQTCRSTAYWSAAVSKTSRSMFDFARDESRPDPLPLGSRCGWSVGHNRAPTKLQAEAMPGCAPSERAFSLLEVMIAMALFFTAIFAILSLTSQSLGAARHLQLSHVDIGGLAGMISLTNRVEEGALPQEIVAQFEEFNPGYTCTGEIMEVSSNGLFRVDFEVVGLHGKKVVGSTMSILMFRPESSASSRNRLRSVQPNPGR